MRTYLFVLLVIMIAVQADAQQVIPLYDGQIPNSKKALDEEKTFPDHNNTPIVSGVQKPTLTVFRPEKPNGTAVMICPGGGYSIVAIQHEGEEVAKKMSEWGLTVFVLKYRIPNAKWMINPEIGPLQDAQQALLFIRKNALNWKIDSTKIGIMGFSAGGHLASTAATHYSTCLVPNPDNISVRPDFQILVYPVISLSDSIGHIGSRQQLLGDNPSGQKIAEYSADHNVDSNTPRGLLIHSAADESVSYKNCLAYFDALRKNNVPADIHIFSKGGHGFGMIKTGLPIDAWMDLIHDWLKTI